MARKLEGEPLRVRPVHDWDTLLDGSKYEVTEEEVGDLRAFALAAYQAARRCGLRAVVNTKGMDGKAQIQSFDRGDT